jgi:hypothetical protein
MNLQKTYASLLTADLAAAEGWYTKMLGRGPDHRPMPTRLHWELSDEGGLMLSNSEEIAVRGAIFLDVDNHAGERLRIDGLAIALGDDDEGEYSTLAQVRDPDSNSSPRFTAQATLPVCKTVPTSRTRQSEEPSQTDHAKDATPAVLPRHPRRSASRRSARARLRRQLPGAAALLDPLSPARIWGCELAKGDGPIPGRYRPGCRNISRIRATRGGIAARGMMP